MGTAALGKADTSRPSRCAPRSIERSKLQWAALAHDVGKLEVDAAILKEKGEPNESEFAELRTHPDEGWLLVAPLRRWLGEWARAVRNHTTANSRPRSRIADQPSAILLRPGPGSPA